MIRDYYNSLKFNKAFEDVSALNKSGIDSFYDLEQIKGVDYKLNRKGYLYFILGRYTTKLFKMQAAYDYLESHPYILDYSLVGDNRELFTSLGNVVFKLCVNNIKEAYIAGKDKKTIGIMCKVYEGKYVTKCHEISSLLGIDYEYITTAFVNSPLEDYRYLHSFVEDGDNVYDFAKNLKMKKEDYYSLLEPEVVSRIKGNILIDDLLQISHNYPPMSLKEFLVRHDDLILRK